MHGDEGMDADLSRIADALRSLTPEPSARLYSLVSDQPWFTEANSVDTGTLRKRLPNWGLPLVTARALALAIIIATLLGLLLIDGKALAQRIEDFFRRAADQVISLQLESAEEPEPLTNLELDEVARMTEFDLLLPEKVPFPFAFQSAIFFESTGGVMLNYSDRGRILWITEQVSEFAGDSHPSAQIGPDAEVMDVTVAGQPAELVRGAWRIRADTNGPASEATWTSEVPAMRLRWRLGDLHLELFVAGGSPGHPGYLEQDELVALAESLR